MAIFLVHGREPNARHAVARVVERITTEQVVILDEQPASAETVIEKYENNALRARYAIVLMTGDDEGSLRGEAPRPRARQNVIFEYGFFVAALGRKCIAVLYEEGVEIPGDVQGVSWISYSADGNWPLRLARELDAAGITVDFAKLMS